MFSISGSDDPGFYVREIGLDSHAAPQR